ncbi:unnamed protein product [Tilletia caries]|nr:unnamed protein product [Tilletia caries]
MQHVFDRQPRREHSLKLFIRSTIGHQLLNWKVKLAIDAVIGFHFHAFPRPIHHGVHDFRAPFHPSVHDPVNDHRLYWDFFQGTEASRIPNLYELQQSLTRARLPLLHSVSIDLRAHEPITRSSLRLWKTMHAPRWVLSTTVLARMSVASYGIHELHIRLTAQQDHIDLVEEIVANNVHLQVIHIEVDSAIVNGRHIRPTIRLHKMFPHSRPHADIKRLVIRAPGCLVECFIGGRDLRVNLLDHLYRTSEFVLVCSGFNAVTPTFDWLNCLLQKMSRVQHLDIAICEPDPRAVNIPQVDLPYVHLRKLEKLSLQLPEVEGRFLRCIRAVSLYKLRIKSNIPLSDWLPCDDNHFPSLFIAHIQCKGPSAPRLSTLGVEERFFEQNLNKFHNWANVHSLPFLAYIKPYTRRRVSLPSSVASSDSDTESEDASTTWSELSAQSGSSSGSLDSSFTIGNSVSLESSSVLTSSGSPASSSTLSVSPFNGPGAADSSFTGHMPASSTSSVVTPMPASIVTASNQDSVVHHSPLATFAHAVAGLAGDGSDSNSALTLGGSTSAPASKRMRMF